MSGSAHLGGGRKAVLTPCETLQTWFNESDLLNRLKRGNLRSRVKTQHAAPPNRGFPPGTMSQLVEYLGPSDVLEAEIHQYLTPAGQIAASGMPDPKGMLRDGVWHYCI